MNNPKNQIADVYENRTAHKPEMHTDNKTYRRAKAVFMKNFKIFILNRTQVLLLIILSAAYPFAFQGLGQNGNFGKLSWGC